MNKKKIFWIFVLIIFIIGIIFLTSFLNEKSNKNNSNGKFVGRNTEKNVKINNENVGKYIKTQLDDGILYSKTGKKVKPDIVIETKFFDTTINDIYLNPNTYKGKKIEVEGFYLSNLPYTFVGRYSNSNMCAYCPVGYSYIEYQLDGVIDETFTDEKEWLKVVGTLEVGNDETSNYTDYYYLKVLSLEIMNEKGEDTVNN